MDDFRRLAKTLNDLSFSHSEEVLNEGRSGGLGLFWGDGVKVRVRSKSTRFIDAELEGGPGDPRWRFTWFYGHPKTSLRHLSWQAIRDLCDEDSLPWVLIGDFNEILTVAEKEAGRRRRECQMRGFQEVVAYADLIDLGYVGSKFTWSNRHTKIRLDRSLATTSWSDIFPNSRVIVLPPSILDHSPLLLQACSGPIVQVQKFHRFRFESFWLQHPECDQVVNSHWQSSFFGQPMFIFTQKV